MNLDELHEQYKPLRLRLYKKYHPYFGNQRDKEDLMSEISALFCHLFFEYDPDKGVDFPYYIKTKLEWRVMHYVNKQTNHKNREVLIESLTTGQVNFEDDIENQEELENILNVLSWDDDFSMGKKQKKLFIDLLQNKKTIKQIAEEENVPTSTIHTRLHFLVKKLKRERQNQREHEAKFTE